MTSTRSRPVRAIALAACLCAWAEGSSAQGFEVTPIGGYRFGGDFFELLTQRPLDLDGAPAVGVVVDVPTKNGFQVEGLFSHQAAHVFVPAFPLTTPVRWDMSVDHWQAGGLQEFDSGRARPFLVGSLGLTRYATAGDSEIRFSFSAAGGVKLFPTERIGVRLTAQSYTTVVDAATQVFACTPGRCLVGFNAAFVWQMEFTAGLIVRIR